METYHAIHVPRATSGDVVLGLDHILFQRYYRREKASGTTLWTMALGDAVNGWVSVYDQGENFQRANLLAKGLSAYLHRPALWMGLFEELDFYYQLFHDGVAIDAYDSDASIFDPAEGYTDDPEGAGWLPADFSGLNKDRNIAGLGDPAAFFSVLARGEPSPPVTRLQSLLSRGRAFHGPGTPDFEELSWAEEGVAAFARLIGLDEARATTGFDKMEAGAGLPDWARRLEYHKIPHAGDAPRRKRKGEAP